MARRCGIVQPASPNDALIASWNFLDGSIAPNFGGAYPTFTRPDATAARVNSSGLIEVAAADTPRFDFDPVTKAIRGLLIEGTRANAAWPSEDFTHANYGKTGVVASSDSVTNPRGGSAASLLTSTAGAGYHYASGGALGTLTSGTAYSQLFIVKKGTQRYSTVGEVGGALWIVATFDFDTETFTNQTNCTARLVKKHLNGWYEISVTFTRSDTSNGQLMCSFGPVAAGVTAQNYTASGAETGYWFAGQHEVGAFSTSYIPTTTAAVTRNADIAYVLTSAITGFSVLSGAALAEFIRGDDVARYASVLSIGNSAAERIVIGRGAASASAAYFDILTGGGTSFFSQTPAYTTTSSQGARIAIAYEANNFAGTTDGQAPATDITGAVPSISGIRIGNAIPTSSGETEVLNGHVRKLHLFNRRLTNAELQALTA